MFDEYQRIRIINLPERQDRRHEMEGELRRLGLAKDSRLSFFPAIRPAHQGKFRSVGAHGCFLSHLAILEEANGESVLILEDDCDFTTAVHNPRPKSDLLWGGYTIHPNHIEGTVCIGFNGTTARRAAVYLKDIFAGRPVEVDGAYLHFCRDNPDVHVHACSPLIVVQRPSHSDVAGPHGLDRHPFAAPLMKLLRKAKRIANRGQTEAGSFQALVEKLRAAK